MDPPARGDEAKPEKLEEEKEGGPSYHCDLFDSEVVHKIAQSLLPGLASACVDNTTGGLMRNAESVAVDMRREMVDYLIQRSQNFLAESVVLDGGPDAELSDHPFDIISSFVDDFARSKRNFFSKVSEWMLSDRREDRIDDFVQEMELDGFWLLGRREAVAQTLLKNVDFKDEFQCNISFKNPEELEEHKQSCKFKTLNCMNEGCNARFSAAHLEQHDSVCPFKILPCEQNCSESIMRREMDRHCITLCPMKLVKCPFYPVGCKTSIPQCRINEHRLDDLNSHLLYVLRVLYKEVPIDDLRNRMEQIKELSSPEQLAALRDARSLTFSVKKLDAKLGPIEQTNLKPKHCEDNPELMDKKERLSSTTSEDYRVSIDKKESAASPEQLSPSPDPSLGDAGKKGDAKLEPSEETKMDSKPNEEARETLDEKETSAACEQLTPSPDPSSPADVGNDRDAKLGPSEETKKESEPSEEDINERSVSPEPLVASQDARSSAYAAEDLDTKVGPLKETKIETNPSEEDQESIHRKEASDSSTKSEENQESIDQKENSASSMSGKEGIASPSKSGDLLQ